MGDVLDREVGDVDVARVPVPGVTDQVGMGVRHVTGQPERPGADRLGRDGTGILESLGAHYHAVLAREQVRDLVVDIGEVEREARRAVDDDLGDGAQLRGHGRVGLVLAPLDVLGHGLRVERRAVGEGQARAQREGHAQPVAGVRPRRGQAGPDVAVGQDSGDCGVDEAEDVVVPARTGGDRVP